LVSLAKEKIMQARDRLNRLKTVADIFEVMGGTTSIARILGVGVSTASEIKRRGRIPAEYWRDIIRTAAMRGQVDITADLLTDLHARQKEPEGLAEEDRTWEMEAHAEHGPSAENAGQFTRFKHLRRKRFRTLEEINDHVDALRDEWSRR
jgi:hypothetical protein